VKVSALKLAPLALLLAFGAVACGSQTEQQPAAVEETLNFVPAGEWKPLVDGVEVAVQENGAVLVTTSRTAMGYQVDQRVSVAGHSTISVRYDITTTGGPGFIGVLMGDGSRWLGNFELATDAQSSNTVDVPVSGDEVRVVIQNGRDSTPGSFTLNNVEFAVH
jgi:hypothetical protein